MKIRYYTDEFKYKDLQTRMKGIKEASFVHIHSVDQPCSHRSDQDVRIINFSYYGTFESIQGLPGRIGITCDVISPAKVTFKVKPDKEQKDKKPDSAALLTQLSTAAGVRKADVSGETATIYIDLEALNPEAIDNAAKYAGYRATLSSHEYTDIEVKPSVGKYKEFKRGFAYTRGVCVLQGDSGERKLTMLTLKGKFDDKKLAELIEPSKCEVVSIKRRP